MPRAIVGLVNARERCQKLILMSEPRKVYFVSLGCPKNQVDTEVMLGVVAQGGHELVDDAELADTLVVNTCGFIDAAKEESIDTILELAAVKKDAAAAKTLVVAGCLSQRYPEELANEMPEVDHFLGSADQLGLAKVLRGQAPRMGVTALGKRAYLYDHTTPRQVTGTRHSVYVKIAEGCDRPCGFCIIPQLRGAQRSRSVYSVVEEVHALVEHGAREVCLVAQDLTLYGKDLEPRATLEQLLDALVQIDGLHWIRLHYAYPTAVTEGLVERIAGQPKIATYLDVPMQHVDSGVLKKMRRGYGEKQVRELVDMLRDPRRVGDAHVWLRTTMLVGHPGETEDAYRRLHDFVAEGQLDHLGVFPWSREEGTASALHPGRVDEAVAQERAAELMALQAEIRARKHAELVGRTLEILVDGPSAEHEWLLDGRHEGQALEIDGLTILTNGPTHGAPARGQIVRAKVVQAGTHDLVASLDLDVDPDDVLPLDDED
ncbi:30S ribosomal protein S12 methylthiotransferase RimO [Paraliomyxa miuraensis]|uniref:30S ribosomal protein S12 methylthiotransferase RimO n=1 Tax=Paraliomyxa miuraensis TaxID=376150 RepID=UPI00225BDEF3|nr:30S ribosomal protein S12 methylthiotransferase RimO [Paraliomyxa miuraensis]MCX4239209.1 30S ribosomal protein S12 methylthiotransferase RimO [Paraliomyxa miuraensis]